MTRITLLAFLMIVTCASCNFVGGKRVKGNGNISTTERNVSAFNEVEVSGAIDVHVSQGELKPVRIEGDENLLSYVEVEQMGDKIEVRTKRGYNLRPTKKMKLYLSSPNYNKLDVSGACNISSDNKLALNNPLELQVSGAGDINVDVNAPRVEAQVSGSGNVNMSGETKNFELTISGAGDAKCYEFLTENTKVNISGAGSAEVFASVELDAHVSGAGSIKYKGNAPKVNQHVSGAGSVKKAE
ncbi:MAG TPA: head GIN domain-containing protein [Chitinophagaceae bacterium]|nr:head GIN domain-containing protein [Chitinophagaceae bacterium]